MIHAGALILLLAGGFDAFGGSHTRNQAAAPVPGTVGWFGDSITAGACSGTAPSAVLDAQLPSAYLVVNAGVSGETAHEIASRVLSDSGTTCVGEPCGTYVLQGGVNTLKHAAFNAAPAESVAAVALAGDGGGDGSHDRGMIDAADHLHSAHPASRILIVGVLPYAGCSICGANPNPGARATAYNAALMDACSSRAWLTCIVPYAAFEGAPPDHLRAEYACGDGLHLVDQGSYALAATVFAATSW